MTVQERLSEFKNDLDIIYEALLRTSFVNDEEESFRKTLCEEKAERTMCYIAPAEDARHFDEAKRSKEFEHGDVVIWAKQYFIIWDVMETTDVKWTENEKHELQGEVLAPAQVTHLKLVSTHGMDFPKTRTTISLIR